MAPDAPPLLLAWEDLLDDLMQRTEKFPKVTRFTLASRIDNLAMDILDQLTIARFERQPRQKLRALRQADLYLARLRTFIRLAFRRHCLDRGAFQYLATLLDARGRELGAWMASLENA